MSTPTTAAGRPVRPLEIDVPAHDPLERHRGDIEPIELFRSAVCRNPRELIAEIERYLERCKGRGAAFVAAVGCRLVRTRIPCSQLSRERRGHVIIETLAEGTVDELICTSDPSDCPGLGFSDEQRTHDIGQLGRILEKHDPDRPFVRLVSFEETIRQGEIVSPAGPGALEPAPLRAIGQDGDLVIRAQASTIALVMSTSKVR